MVKELVREEILTREEDELRIVLFNDEFNTFDFVIKSLVEVCEHSSEQAEQCAMIVHHKGKYAVKHGGFPELEPRWRALVDRGLSAEIQ